MRQMRIYRPKQTQQIKIKDFPQRLLLINKLYTNELAPNKKSI